MASIDEMKELMLKSLEHRGVLGQIRAQVRAAVFTAIDEQERADGVHMENPRLSKLKDSKHGMLLLSLVDDFLGFYGLSYTRSCLLSEAQIDEETVQARPQMLSQLPFASNDMDDGSYPVLLRVLGAAKGVGQSRRAGAAAGPATPERSSGAFRGGFHAESKTPDSPDDPLRNTVGKKAFGAGRAGAGTDLGQGAEGPRLHSPPGAADATADGRQDEGGQTSDIQYRVGTSPKTRGSSDTVDQREGDGEGEGEAPPSASAAIAGLASPGDYASDSFDDSSVGAGGSPSPYRRADRDRRAGDISGGTGPGGDMGEEPTEDGSGGAGAGAGAGSRTAQLGLKLDLSSLGGGSPSGAGSQEDSAGAGEKEKGQEQGSGGADSSGATTEEDEAALAAQLAQVLGTDKEEAKGEGQRDGPKAADPPQPPAQKAKQLPAVSPPGGVPARVQPHKQEPGAHEGGDDDDDDDDYGDDDYDDDFDDEEEVPDEIEDEEEEDADEGATGGAGAGDLGQAGGGSSRQRSPGASGGMPDDGDLALSLGESRDLAQSLDGDLSSKEGEGEGEGGSKGSGASSSEGGDRAGQGQGQGLGLSPAGFGASRPGAPTSSGGSGDASDDASNGREAVDDGPPIPAGRLVELVGDLQTSTVLESENPRSAGFVEVPKGGGGD